MIILIPFFQGVSVDGQPWGAKRRWCVFSHILKPG